ncbi:hypothetical protein ACA910_019856 [Epithemia clementina (nom. ined.)]
MSSSSSPAANASSLSLPPSSSTPSSRRQSRSSFPYVALWSGGCGAVASSLAKIAFSRTSVLQSVRATVVGLFVSHKNTTTTELTGLRNHNDGNETTDEEWSFSSSLLISWNAIPELLVRLVFLVAMIVCNIVAVGTFVQGLEESGSVKGTALTTAANCILSSLLGIVLWNDQVPSKLGLACVLLGIVVLVTTTEETTTEHQPPPPPPPSQGDHAAVATSKPNSTNETIHNKNIINNKIDNHATSRTTDKFTKLD